MRSWLIGRLRRWHTLSWRPERSQIHTALGDILIALEGEPTTLVGFKAFKLRRERDTWVPYEEVAHEQVKIPEPVPLRVLFHPYRNFFEVEAAAKAGTLKFTHDSWLPERENPR